MKKLAPNIGFWSIGALAGYFAGSGLQHASNLLFPASEWGGAWHFCFNLCTFALAFVGIRSLFRRFIQNDWMFSGFVTGYITLWMMTEVLLRIVFYFYSKAMANF